MYISDNPYSLCLFVSNCTMYIKKKSLIKFRVFALKIVMHFKWFIDYIKLKNFNLWTKKFNFSSLIKIFLCLIPAGSVANSCNPAPGRPEFGLTWGKGLYYPLIRVELVSALSPASTWPPWRSSRWSSLLMRGVTGQRGNPAAKSFRVGQW